MSDYYILITDAGAALEAAAHAAGEKVELAEFGVCDGGVDFVPDPAATTFPNEVYRGAISSLTISETDPTVFVAQCIIPATSGGYTVRGIALYASDGTLYATGNYANQDKPAPDSGFAVSLEILAELAVSDTSDITLVVSDTAYLTEAQADTLYLRQDKQLAEIASQGEAAQKTARDNLALKTAATHDVQESRDDITAGRVLVNGGALALRSVHAKAGEAIADASALPANSVSFCYADAAFSPGYEATILDVGGLGGDGYRVQYAASYADGGKQLKFRTLNADNGNWGAWTNVITNYGGTVDHLDGASYYQTNPAAWPGVGAFADQYGSAAPFNIPYGHVTPKGISQYLPIIKAISSTEEYGFGSAVSFGISRSGNNDFGAAAIHIIGDNGLAAGYFFDTNGTFNAPGQVYSGGRIDAAGDMTAGGSVYVGTAPTGGSLFVGGATYGNNGDVNGSVWGGWLSSWLENNVVHDIRLGAMGSQPTHDDYATSMVPSGCTQAGLHSNYNDSNWEVDSLYYWPLQKYVGGAWWNVGSGVGSRSAETITPVDIPLPVVSLTRFLNARPYRDETTPDDTGGMPVDGVLVDYADSNGYLWSKAQKLMSGNVFISYDSAGVIRHISDDATKLRLEGLSVAGLDSIPDECSIDGTWKFDGETISRDSAIVDSKTLALNKERLVNRAIKASAAIAMIQASAAAGNPRAGDADNLLLVQQYADALRDVDITQAEPIWPPVPDLMN